MELVANLLTWSHVGAGFTGLILFWVPIFTRKGGLNHRRIGNYYVWAMWVVLITALALSVYNLAIGRTLMAMFLGFLSLITAKPLYLGVSVLSNKRDISAPYRHAQTILSGLVVAGGAGMVVYGLVLGGTGLATFMIIFGVIGLSSIFDLLASIKQAPSTKHWLEEHIASMCITGIAAHTAFLAFGAQGMFEQLYSSHWAIIPWVAPTVIGVVGIRVAINRYKREGRISVA